MKNLVYTISLIILISLSSFTFDKLPVDLTFTSDYPNLVEVENVVVRYATQTENGEIRKLPEFTQINLSISANIFLTQGANQEVRIEASKDDLEEIVTKVKNGELYIKTDSWTSSLREVNIYITMQNITAIAVAGSGNISAKGAINCSELELSVAGSGNMEFKDLKANELVTSIAGSGDLYLAGTGVAKEYVVKIAGSGDVNAKNFAADEVTVNIAGSGDCYVNAKRELDVNIAGSGDVYYKGNPEVDQNVVGSGDVERL